MTSAALSLPVRPDLRPHSPVDRHTLSVLRLVGARCRVLARSDVFEACAMLSTEKDRATEAVATALFRALNGTGGLPRLRLYQLNAQEVSFDEQWLLAALAAARRGDTDSLTFLLARRLSRHTRRQIGFLIAALAAALDEKQDAA